MPGLVRASDGLVRLAPHLGWTDAPIRALVEEAVSLPTFVGNDASLGAIAEHLFGAGRGVDDVVYLNGGASGIGGGLIVHGIPIGGSGGYAGEFGQNRPGIAAQDDRRAAGGVLEDEVSRARLLAVAGLPAADEPTLAAALAASDSPAVTAELARQRRILSTALANAVNVLNPSLVVLGGFLATVAESDPDALAAAVADAGDAGGGRGPRHPRRRPRRGPAADRGRRARVRAAARRPAARGAEPAAQPPEIAIRIRTRARCRLDRTRG